MGLVVDEVAIARRQAGADKPRIPEVPEPGRVVEVRGATAMPVPWKTRWRWIWSAAMPCFS